MWDSDITFAEKHSQIQSGQFMVSKLDDSESDQEVETLENSSQVAITDSQGSVITTFDNLQSLFNRLRLAYVENLTSPRWSHFKGAGFALKNKVRLNNIIWREYHMQYVKELPSVIVKFRMPINDNCYENKDGLFVYSKYRRRQSETLRDDYRRWRSFFKTHLCEKPTIRPEKRMLGFENPPNYGQKMPYMLHRDLFNDLPGVDSPHHIEDIISDFDCSLALFVDQPFPTSRDITQLGNSDIMQPGLAQLQHNAQSCRSDLITSLLQQPAMPTIAEDEYFNGQSQEFYQIPHQQYTSGNQTVSDACYPLNYIPFTHIQPAYRQPCYKNAAAKHRPLPEPMTYSSQPVNVYFPLKNSQQSQKEVSNDVNKSPDAPRNNLTLLNALLQEPKPEGSVGGSPVRAQHLSVSSDSIYRNLLPPSIGSQPRRQQQYQRERSSSMNNPLIVDLSNNMVLPMDVSVPQPPQTSISMNKFPTPGEQTLCLDTRCQAVEQSHVANPAMAEGAFLGYHQPSSAAASLHHRMPSAERYFGPGPTTGGPPSRAFTPVGAQTSFRRGCSVFNNHPNPFYRNLVHLPASSARSSKTSTHKCNSISSAPDIYGTYDVALTGTTSNPAAAAIGFYSPSSSETKHDSSLDDDESPSITAGVANFRAGDSDVDVNGISIVGAPTSSAPSFRPSSGESPVPSGNTEQRRRMSIQSCLQVLQELVKKSATEAGTGSSPIGVTTAPRGSQQQIKMSKASILLEAADLIKKQKSAKANLDSEINRLQSEIDSLQNSINVCCEKLPVSSGSSKRQTTAAARSSEATAWYHHFVANASEANWKFYVFSLIINELFGSYCDKVCSTSSRDVLRRSIVNWIEDHCNLPHLRRYVTQALCQLSITTNILQQPHLLPQQSREAAARLAAVSNLQLAPLPASSTRQQTPRDYSSPSSPSVAAIQTSQRAPL